MRVATDTSLRGEVRGLVAKDYLVDRVESVLSFERGSALWSILIPTQLPTLEIHLPCTPMFRKRYFECWMRLIVRSSRPCWRLANFPQGSQAGLFELIVRRSPRLSHLPSL
jgi:hypothetical protein